MGILGGIIGALLLSGCASQNIADVPLVRLLPPERSRRVESYCTDLVVNNTGFHVRTCCVIALGQQFCINGQALAVDKEMDKYTVTIVTKQGTLKRIARFSFLFSTNKYLTMEDYWKYLIHNLQNAHEAGQYIQAVASYRENGEKKPAHPYRVLTTGGGDCDDLAYLMQKLLIDICRKRNFDYRARVIIYKKHAAAIFLDEDGQWKIFPQKMPFRIIFLYNDKFDLASADSHFSKSAEDLLEGKQESFIEGSIGEKGTLVEVSIDKLTLQQNMFWLVIRVERPCNEQLNPGDFYTVTKWKKFQKVQLQFQDATIFYESGILVQKTYETGTTLALHFDGEGKIIQKKYRNGVTEFFHRNGMLSQRQDQDANTDFFDERGFLIQRDYADGVIEHFDNNGQVIQRKNKDGSVEIFVENTLRQRNHSDGSIELFNETGTLIERRSPNGEIGENDDLSQP